MIAYEKLAGDFKKLVTENKLSHAYLFFGDTEDKNLIFAKSLANFLENRIFEEPVALLEETLLVCPDEKNSIGIDAVRNLKNFLWQKPINSSRRTAIIYCAQNLTPDAQNAALKIVEEPPEAGLLIFVAKTAENLLATLSSRMQKIFFPNETQINTDKRQINADNSNQYKSVKIPKQMLRIATGQVRINPNESILNETEVDELFEKLITDLSKDKIKNSKRLKEALTRLTLVKQFNTNKKLQWRTMGL